MRGMVIVEGSPSALAKIRSFAESPGFAFDESASNGNRTLTDQSLVIYPVVPAQR